MVESEKIVLDNLLNFNIPKIKDSTNFWMIRTQKGHFYKEFLSEKFVGFGWNIIDKTTDLGSELLPKEIQKSYNKKQGTKAINSCNKFINEITENDIILIPNRNLEEVAIVLAGEYYEESEYTLEDEKGMLWKINNENHFLMDIKCPYKKRRKISIITTIKGSRINYHLYKTLRNYSGIDDIDEHAPYILSMIFESFIYKKNLYICLKVNKKEDIPLSDLSRILYGSSKYFSHFVEKEKVKAKVNVCSEGDIFIVLRDILEHISVHGSTYVGMFLGLVGGTYGIIKVKEIPKFLLEIATIKQKMIQEKEKSQKMKFENELLEIEVEERRMELQNKLIQQSDGDLPSEEEQRLIRDASETLRIEPTDLSEEGRIATFEILEVNEQALS